MAEGTRGSLAGLRVIEISTSVAGPLAGQILGDLGAEVIKVERVGSGDDTRQWTPPAWDGESIAFLHLNRNKLSLELDYKDPRGRRVLRDLIASADVLVQNLRPGALAKVGFSWEELQEINPRLVYCDMTGFGRTGPKATEPAYDPLLQAYSGIIDMMGTGDGPPARVPLSILDKGTAMWAAIGVLDALRTVERTGKGVHVGVSLLETAVTWTHANVMGALAGNGKPKNLGSGHAGVVPYGAFPTRDGWAFISAGNQALWTRFCTATGAEELATREGFGSNPERSANREQVEAAVSEVTRGFETAGLITLLNEAGIPCSAVNSVPDMVDDPQVKALGLIEPMAHTEVENFEVVNLPITFGGEYPEHQCPPPVLGADTDAVLSRLGVSAESIAELRRDGVVASVADRP
ncbi:CoA transferase [Nocardioides sp. W7]|uniref:CaiB/BaiF CoA transferase family protein n=1 Tax=Nocardioides sp. W7 TaxID=2931390 RepID=UPI001FD49B69|nr:CoA transferase [Nocardioides sp. W7]